ncbi:MAG: hypothetical protein ACKOX6_10580 [Bdellovibrio sp.]
MMYKMQAVQLGYGSTTSYISGTGTSYSSGVLPAPTTSNGTSIYGR